MQLFGSRARSGASLTPTRWWTVSPVVASQSTHVCPSRALTRDATLRHALEVMNAWCAARASVMRPVQLFVLFASRAKHEAQRERRTASTVRPQSMQMECCVIDGKTTTAHRVGRPCQVTARAWWGEGGTTRGTSPDSPPRAGNTTRSGDHGQTVYAFDLASCRGCGRPRHR